MEINLLNGIFTFAESFVIPILLGNSGILQMQYLYFWLRQCAFSHFPAREFFLVLVVNFHDKELFVNIGFARTAAEDYLEDSEEQKNTFFYDRF